MNRLIGIDYGKQRTGLAVSDPLCLFAIALKTIHSTNIIDYIKKYESEFGEISCFVVGYPLNLNGKPSEAASDVDIFLDELRQAFPNIPISLEDERYTSVMAQRVIIDANVKLKQRKNKENIDKISAAIILQSYLDRHNANKENKEVAMAVNIPDTLSHSLSALSQGRTCQRKLKNKGKWK